MSGSSKRDFLRSCAALAAGVPFAPLIAVLTVCRNSTGSRSPAENPAQQHAAGSTQQAIARPSQIDPDFEPGYLKLKGC